MDPRLGEWLRARRGARVVARPRRVTVPNRKAVCLKPSTFRDSTRYHPDDVLELENGRHDAMLAGVKSDAEDGTDRTGEWASALAQARGETISQTTAEVSRAWEGALVLLQRPEFVPAARVARDPDEDIPLNDRPVKPVSVKGFWAGLRLNSWAIRWNTVSRRVEASHNGGEWQSWDLVCDDVMETLSETMCHEVAGKRHAWRIAGTHAEQRMVKVAARRAEQFNGAGQCPVLRAAGVSRAAPRRRQADIHVRGAAGLHAGA